MLWLLLLVWTDATTAMERPAEVLLRALSRPFAPVAPDAEISAQCREHSLLYLRELEDLAPWAIHMYDASTKIPPGVVTGNIQQLGNYDQCLAISVHRERHSFRGQLCTATVQFAVGGFSNDSQLNNATGAEAEGAPGLREIIMAVARAADLKNWTGPLIQKYEWAFCVPSSCSASDVEAALNHALLPLNTSGVAEMMVSAEPERCLTAGSGPQLKARDYSFIVMVALFSGLVVLSTIYDLAAHRSPWCNKDINRRCRTQLVLAAFSLYSNARHVFSTHQKADTMACLNGMRFLTMVWIIFGHTYYQKAVSPQINAITITHFSSDWSKMLIMNATVSADTFFMLSGLLLAFNLLRERQRRPSFNLAAFYLHRYFRITPVYAVVVFFYATLFQFVGSGPLWGKWVLTNRDNCLANWWTNLLYVNNFVNVPQMCLSQSWYLAVDMQLMWLSPIVLVPLWKWRRVGRCVLGAALCAAIVSPFVITVVHHLAGVMIYTSDSIVGVFLDVYIPVYTRGGPYIIGIALGSALFATKARELHFSKVQVAVCWLLAALFGVVGVFGAFGIYQPDHVYNVWEAGVYAALHRPLWALGLAWVVVACVNGYGGPVNALLSWPYFQPLSRLTYGAYLAHFSVMLYNSGTMRTPGYLSDYSVIHDFLGNLMLTLAIAVVLVLVFEIPFVNLDHALFPAAVAGGTNGNNGNNGNNGTNGNNVMAEYHTLAGEEAAAAPVDPDLEAGTAQGGYDNGAFEQPTPSSQHRSPEAAGATPAPDLSPS